MFCQVMKKRGRLAQIADLKLIKRFTIAVKNMATLRLETNLNTVTDLNVALTIRLNHKRLALSLIHI